MNYSVGSCAEKSINPSNNQYTSNVPVQHPRPSTQGRLGSRYLSTMRTSAESSFAVVTVFSPLS